MFLLPEPWLLITITLLHLVGLGSTAAGAGRLVRPAVCVATRFIVA